MPTSRSHSPVDACWLGSVPYREAWELQRALVTGIRAGRVPETLLLLEHPHVFTMGRGGVAEHLLWSETERRGRAVELVWSDRGGDATYHGPGQLVGYPLLDLRTRGRDVLAYLRNLERSLIAFLAGLGIQSAPGGPGLTGVWVPDHGQERKLAAIGVKLSHWITSHGFALNLSSDLGYFEGIVACGLEGRSPTSLERLTGRLVETEAAARAYAPSFAAVFASELTWRDSKDVWSEAASSAPSPGLEVAREQASPLLNPSLPARRGDNP
ncbi:MAG TPA: lipoyl(octanoyl) transferase LipB [Candidatus Acidoferrales bacterium]|nr:lipoyl(octanoyl) transferase LipB [Candidatus Acidoferrales bacterium]